MDRKFCDQCRKEILVGRVYYYTITLNRPPTGMISTPMKYDLCSWSCVQDKAEEERM